MSRQQVYVSPEGRSTTQRQVCDNRSLMPLVRALQAQNGDELDSVYMENVSQRLNSQQDCRLADCDRLAYALARNRTFTSLLLRNYPTAVCLALAESLRLDQARFVRSLALRFTRGREQCYAALAEALAQNTTLLSFTLDMCATDLSDVNGVALAEAMQQNTALQSVTLYMASTLIGDRTGEALAQALKRSTSLQSAILYFGPTWRQSARQPNISIGDVTGAALADALKQNTTLLSVTLNLGHTSIRDATGAALAEALRQNTTLQSVTLNTWRTQIGDETGTALAEALTYNTTLQSITLDLGDTQISNETGTALAEALKQNTGLQSFTLYMGHNSTRPSRIDDMTGVALAEALKQNTALRSISLSMAMTDISLETGDALMEALKQNTTVQSVSLDIADTPLMLMGYGTRLVATSKEVLERNRALPGMWHELTRVARQSQSPGVRDITAAMTERGFRRAIFSFFLPDGWQWPAVRKARFLGEAGEETVAEAEHATAGLDQPAEHLGSASSSDAEKEDQLTLALQMSRAEADAQGNAALARAVLHSRADAGSCLGDNGVLLLQLTRYAKAAEVAEVLRSSPELASCRAIIAEAGCEMQPSWAGGAWLLIPLTEEQVLEVGPELQLPPFSSVHVLCLQSDEQRLRLALQAVPRRLRPKLRLVAGTARTAQGRSEGEEEEDEPIDAATAVPGSENPRLCDEEIVVRRTFVHFAMPHDVEASSTQRSFPS